MASAWNQFTTLLASGLDFSLPDPILLQHFYKGLSRESRKLLDTTSRGSFLHVSSKKARLILDQILSIELDYLLEVEPQPQLAEPNPSPDTPSTSANTCLEQKKEEILFPDFMLDIEPDLFTEFGNVLNYHSMKRPQRNSRESFDPPEDIPSGRTSGEFVSIISNEWLEESELSTEIIRLDSSSIPIHCIINIDQIKALYNPI